MLTTNALTPAQLRELTEELHAERARIARAIGADAGGAGANGASPSGTGSLGEDETAARTLAAERYDAILEAIARLDDGSYGICAGCAQPIPFGRLLVMPETKHCVTCGARA